MAGRLAGGVTAAAKALSSAAGMAGVCLCGYVSSACAAIRLNGGLPRGTHHGNIGRSESLKAKKKIRRPAIGGEMRHRRRRWHRLKYRERLNRKKGKINRGGEETTRT